MDIFLGGNITLTFVTSLRLLQTVLEPRRQHIYDICKETLCQY